MTTFQAQPVHINFAHDTMDGRQHNEKHGELTSSPRSVKMKQGENDVRYGEAHNQILDRQAGRGIVGNAIQYDPRLDQSWNVPGISSWWPLARREQRTGGMAEETAEQVPALGDSPKNHFGPPENGKLDGGP